MAGRGMPTCHRPFLMSAYSNASAIYKIGGDHMRILYSTFSVTGERNQANRS